MSRAMLPERLNLAIARRCDVACSGCYTYFGREEPDLAKFTASAAAFVRCGHAIAPGLQATANL